MKMAIIYFSSIILFSSMTCLSASADTLMELSGPVGDTLREIRSAWSGNNKFGGIIKNYSKGDCGELFEQTLINKIPGVTYSYAYFLKAFEIKEIKTGQAFSLDNNKSPAYAGLGMNYYGHMNAPSPRVATHINRNCHEFMSISFESVLEKIMVYPVYKNGKKTKNVKIETKVCRMNRVSLDELLCNTVMCVGDKDAYLIF